MIRNFQVFVNGKYLPKGRIEVHEDRLNDETVFNVVLPHLDGYAEYLKLCDEAPTLDHVMFNWHKEAVS